MDENKIPIWEKANLTINEAAEYFNIGKNKLRESNRPQMHVLPLYRKENINKER